MYEFGEEFIIESYKVPWLIWIQLLVMILLIILLFYGITIFSVDSTAPIQSTNNSSSASSSSSASGQSQVNNNPVTETRNVKGNSGGEITPEHIQAREGPSLKDARFKPLRPEHPCHYLGLAKQAFLKCLGLDSGSESSGERNEHIKTD